MTQVVQPSMQLAAAGEAKKSPSATSGTAYFGGVEYTKATCYEHNGMRHVKGVQAYLMALTPLVWPDQVWMCFLGR